MTAVYITPRDGEFSSVQRDGGGEGRGGGGVKSFHPPSSRNSVP